MSTLPNDISQANSGLHIKRFVDKISALDGRAKDYVMTVTDAKYLHSDITKLLLENISLRDTIDNIKHDDTITVQASGDDF